MTCLLLVLVIFYCELMFRETFSVGIIRALCLKSHSLERNFEIFQPWGNDNQGLLYNPIFTSVVVVGILLSHIGSMNSGPKPM